MITLKLISPQKETTATTKERPNLLEKVKATMYHGLIHGQVERILMHLKAALIYYAKYKKEENKVKALNELLKEGVAEVTATEEKNHEHKEECNIETLL